MEFHLVDDVDEVVRLTLEGSPSPMLPKDLSARGRDDDSAVSLIGRQPDPPSRANSLRSNSARGVRRATPRPL